MERSQSPTSATLHSAMGLRGEVEDEEDEQALEEEEVEAGTSKNKRR
jgi:hypothetical protein